MLTKLVVRNFKGLDRWGQVEIELGNPVVFIGPNNSGKTSALQALALWELGLKRWNEKRKGKNTPEQRPGVTINRRELIAAPVPDANLLWRNLHVRDVQGRGKEMKTKGVCINITVDGVAGDRVWQCGFEFDYANPESFYCRPLRLSEERNPARMPVPDEAGQVQVAFLPPMSGLAANEIRLDRGAVNVRVGEGRTAEVLRNLCYGVYLARDDRWKKVCSWIECLFGAQLEEPQYIAERGEIVMSYKERGVRLDLSSSGRGLQQTLLLLAYMYANPGSVLLLDEPDAHLEILRQREIYQILTDVAQENHNQIIAASHSEVLLNEAAERSVVVAFVGKPHRIDTRGGSQVQKALRDIGFEDYYQAEQTGWVLYLEGATDLAILQAFARKLKHRQAIDVLERPFVRYVGNVPDGARKHFWGVQEAVPHVKGVALFDRLEKTLPDNLGAEGLVWKRREIENYLCLEETLEGYAAAVAQRETIGPLFADGDTKRHVEAMRASVQEVAQAFEALDRGSPWNPDLKVSDEFLTPLFQKYFKKLGMPNIMAKSNFHELAAFVPPDKIDLEVREKLDAIVRVAQSAIPAQEPS
ncbi:MAG: AAA family ATPase [Candidatus Sumerlaeota bacterium]|nr:AAA family ATPase [Candidatus Sumerlaeota bacterium]